MLFTCLVRNLLLSYRMLRSDHLLLKKFLRKMTLNNMVNNWSTEIESFNINFIHISGKANILAGTLSRLIDTNPDLK